jgi:hypothetical protein
VLHSYTGRYIERKPMLRSYKGVTLNITDVTRLWVSIIWCYKVLNN